MVADGYPKRCHCEAQRAVAISNAGVAIHVAPINIVHFRFLMLIGLMRGVAALLEIATSLTLLAMTVVLVTRLRPL